MIHLKRPLEPGFFVSSKVTEEIKRMADYYNQSTKSREEMEYKSKNELNDEIKNLLLRAFNYKCAFCETELLDKKLSYIERFRPSINAMDLNGKISKNHYWWLRYEWNNLYPICKDCDRKKSNLFPIKRKRAKPLVYGEELLKEQPLLLDPCADKPEEHFLFDFDSGFMISNSERGRVTIDVYGLNRRSLKTKRLNQLMKIEFEFSSLLSNIESFKKVNHSYKERDIKLSSEERKFLNIFKESKEPFLLIKRQYILSVIEKLDCLDSLFYKSEWLDIIQSFSRNLNEEKIEKEMEQYNDYLLEGDSYNLDKRNKLQFYFRKSLYIEQIEICNFKTIKNLKIKIPVSNNKNAPWFLILGENSTGKSSVLKAVALTLMGNENRKKIEGLDARTYLRKGCKSGYVKVYITGRQEPVELFFDKETSNFYGTVEDPPVLLLGYGATRILSEHLETNIVEDDIKATRCENLFNPRVSLVDAELWLSTLNSKNFRDAAQTIKRLFAIEDNWEIRRRINKGKREVVLTMFGIRNKLHELSDGYQSIIALACDIMMVLQNIWEDSEYAQGIVLLDELDVHLHPRWKMQIIDKLKKAFPKLQFISTSHQPLVLRGLSEEEIMVLKRDKKHRLHALENLPSPAGLRIDQILTSPYFGLNTTLDPDVETLFDRYYFLLSEKSLSFEEHQELENIERELKDLELVGDTPRDQLMYRIIDEFLAREKETINKGEVNNLKKETVQRVVNIITSLNIEGE